MASDELILFAHAKVNLALAVGPAIPPGDQPSPHAGMHPIASWVIPVDLADAVRLRRGPGPHTVGWHDGRPVEWSLEADLACRAHRALESLAGPLPAVIQIIKRIPAGGGLGGGSSNAAAVLTGLRALFDLPILHADLARLASTLGSDVPFFLDPAVPPGSPPRPALVTGLGDQIHRIDALPWPPGHDILLICPPFPCSTGRVYRTFDTLPRLDDWASRARAAAQLAEAGALDPAELFNDLADPAQIVEPQLAALRADLARRLAAPVHVSGSGSTLFAILPDAASARRRLASDFPGHTLRVVRPTYLADHH